MPTARMLALVRGINVGRAKRVAMADLRALIEDFGFTDVRTLLNSGNVVFSAPKESSADVAERIEKALVLRLDVDARVVVLTAAEWVGIVRDNTLAAVADDPSRLFVAVPLIAADRTRLEPLLAQEWGDDAFALGTRAAYLWCQAGQLESPLPKAVSRALRDAVTLRNWSTALKLEELLADKP